MHGSCVINQHEAPGSHAAAPMPSPYMNKSWSSEDYGLAAQRINKQELLR
jgi:hypothetical protein